MSLLINLRLALAARVFALGLGMVLASGAGVRAATLETGLHYYAVIDLNRGEVVQRGRAGSAGIAFDQLILGARRPYRILLLQAATFRVAERSLVTPDSGSTFVLGEFRLSPSRAGDADGDGLPDDGELILGTDPGVADTDGDGWSDAAEAREGTDALSGLATRTGILASVRTPGPALDLCAVDNLALVALGERGLAVYNIFTGIEPVAIGWVDTPGVALRVTCSGALAAVADGPAGVSVVDLSDPGAAVRTSQVRMPADALSITAAGGVAFAGLGNGEIAAVDLRSGVMLSRVSVGSAVVDVGMAGSRLYALTDSALHTFEAAGDGLTARGSASTPGVVPFLNKRLVLAPPFAHTVHGRGFNSLRLSELGAPTLLRSRTTTAVGWEHLALASAERVIAAVGPNPAPDPAHDLSLYDLTDPAGDAPLLTTFSTPGSARAVAVFNGLVYLADGDAGLQVLNFLPGDARGQPPVVRLITPTANRAEENTLLSLTAEATDDVHVRNVEFRLDGRSVSTDGSYPFEFRFWVPSLSQGRDFLTVQAIASDLGGRRTATEVLTLTIVPDATPPRFLRASPGDASIVAGPNAVTAYFSEVLDAGSVEATNVVLVGAGADRAFGTLDDVVVRARGLRFDAESTAVVFEPADSLAPGRYRLRLRSGLRDLQGNALAGEVSVEFGVFAPGTDSDGDCVPDSLEPLLGLDPARADTDGDGSLDGEEDFDGDGLTNCGELLVGTDPGRADSNGNGVRDGDEDTDGDGIPDGEETVAGIDGVVTNPLLSDSDGDGISDGAEVALGLDPLDPADRGRDIVIDGRTVSLHGRVELPSLVLRNGAVLTHPEHRPGRVGGLHLVVSNLVVDATSRIDVSGRGYAGGRMRYNATDSRGRTLDDLPGSTQRAGGSHGGLGAPGRGGASVAEIHGDPLQPYDLGGGGSSDSGSGGAGGGRFRLEAGQVRLDGRILANGGDGSGFAGGGAGGSIWVQAGRLTGEGELAAEGGQGVANLEGGGGGGGRIALLAGSVAGGVIDRLAVGPGAGLAVGGPGTIYRRLGEGSGELLLRGTGREVVLPPVSLRGRVIVDGSRVAASSITATELVVTNGGRLTHAPATPEVPTQLRLELERLVVSADSAVDLTGRGYAGSDGLGNRVGRAPVGVVGSGRRTGGSHGGLGGRGDIEDNVATVFGSYANPVLPGGGGGSDLGVAGAGGGVLRLMAQRLVLDGVIASDGGAASQYGGAGAGGSLWITVPRLEGQGSIRANGGASSVSAGAGGGGRIALEYEQAPAEMIEGLTARSPASGFAGGSGTIYLRRGAETPVLRVRHPGRETTLPVGLASEVLRVDGGARVVGGVVEFGDITVTSGSLSARRIRSARVNVESGGVLTHPAMVTTNEVRLEMEVGTLTIASNGVVDLTGRGYAGSDGLVNRVGRAPVGVVGSGRRTGGSHGGLGGRGDIEDNVGTVFGSYANPTLPGGGGGSDLGGAGAGGGVLRLMAQRLVLDGVIASDGGGASQYGGAGAGGSLWITVPRLEGQGSIRANGGASSFSAGAGGGGRIALEYEQAPAEMIEGLTARSPASGFAGGSGTIYLRRGAETPVLRVRHPGRETTLPVGLASEVLRVDGGARVVGGVVEFGDITVTSGSLSARRIRSARVNVESGGVLTHPAMVTTNEVRLEMEVGTLTIASNGVLDLTGRGYAGSDGLGNRVGRTPAGVVGSGRRTGGSHGGLGGRGDIEDNVGTVFGSYANPVLPGGGGGSDIGVAGAGGGVLRLMAQRLVLDGVIASDGGAASQYGGAGAGGSLWITVPRLEGQGSIRANGGASSVSAGAGGGGRIALEYEQAPVEMIEGLTARSPASGFAGGSGTIYLRRGAETPVLRVRHPGRETTLPVGLASEVLRVDGGARVVGGVVEFGDITVTSGSLSARRIRSARVNVESGGVLTHPAMVTTNEVRLEMEVGTLTIASNGVVDLTGRGYAGSDGLVNRVGRAPVGVVGSGRRTGGSHGGLGGRGDIEDNVGTVFGSYANPTLPGGGGGSDLGGAGAGGGVLRLMAQRLVLDGVIASDGGAASQYGGAGAGGSLWITVPRLEGQGSIRANGGASSVSGGAGGGGRIALEYEQAPAEMIEGLTARSPASGFAGGSGTIYLRRGAETPVLRVRHPGRESPLPTGLPSERLVMDRARMVAATLTFGVVELWRGAVLSHPVSTGTATHRLEVRADRMEVDALSRVDVTARGYLGAGQAGNGLGQRGQTLNQEPGSTRRNGGSHGGLGGVGDAGGSVNPTYGEADNPGLPGSGGGSDAGLAGNGGGVLQIEVQRLHVEGEILAEGGVGSTYGGGGSGGSIRILADELSGAGRISVDGGAAGTSAAGGGGGRVVVRVGRRVAEGPRVSAAGGAGFRRGEGGTLVETGR